jgi:subtilisin family serine protease
MYKYGSSFSAAGGRAPADPSDELRIAVTFPRPGGGPGLTKLAAPLSLESVKDFVPEATAVDRAVYELGKLGFTLTKRGRLTASMRCRRGDYEKVFGTALSKVQLDRSQAYAFHSLYYPAEGAAWKPMEAISSIIDDAYIQWPHIYMCLRRMSSAARPPEVDYFHLDVPKDVPAHLNADKVIHAGTTGKGVRIVMVDSGFAHKAHPFFSANGFFSTVDLAPRATNDRTDPNGHGTGESANAFSVAPGAAFIGVKVDNDADPRGGASLLEGFQTALEHRPDIITISMGYDLRDNSGQLGDLPNGLAPLEAEIQAAVASGIVVIFSAGNGHFSFPGMMPDVISAGGVFVDRAGAMCASDYASAFMSKIYSGRSVPDFCGLVGMLPHARYIMLPVPQGCEIDRETADPGEGDPGDGTKIDDGWGVFSGTSAAAPQLAGVCALLLEKNPALSPSDIRAVLRSTSRDVSVGHANPASSDDMRSPTGAGPGDDGATGAGLVDAFAAWKAV